MLEQSGGHQGFIEGRFLGGKLGAHILDALGGKPHPLAQACLETRADAGHTGGARRLPTPMRLAPQDAAQDREGPRGGLDDPFLIDPHLLHRIH